MLTLTRMFLYNWRCFDYHLIDIPENSPLVGVGEDDWDALLDALRVVLLADLRPAHPPTPPPHSEGEEQDTPEPGITYMVLECADSDGSDHLTIGTCIDYAHSRGPASTFFLMPETLEPDLFVSDGYPLTRQRLKQSLRSIRDAHSYDQVGEYRSELLARLGGLNQRFFDIFARLLSFQPPDDIRQFVNEWILEPRPLDVGTLQRVAEPYAQLGEQARTVEDKLTALRSILQLQADARRLRQQHAEYTLLPYLLHQTAADRRVKQIDRQLAHIQQQCADVREELLMTQATLRKAEESLLEAEMALHQTSVMRRQDELQREIKRASSEASIIQSRWLTLLYDLQREEAALRPLLDTEEQETLSLLDSTLQQFLSDEERSTLRSLLDAIATLAADRPPPRSFSSLIDAALPAMDAALLRSLEALFFLRQQIKDARLHSKDLERQRSQLQAGERHYPFSVERIRDLLSHVLGERPPLLCEVLEIPDERWQDAVEALLGAQRYAMLVPPRQHDLALRVLERARSNEHLADVGLLDSDKVRYQKQTIPPGALSHQVQTDFPALRSHIDTLLGMVMTCETVDQLHGYQCAVTPDVVLYRDRMIRAIPPEHYRPWMIGARAQSAQIAACDAALHTQRTRLTDLETSLTVINTQVARLKRVRILATLRQRLDVPLDERPIRAQIAGNMAQQQALNTGDIAEQQHERDRLHTIVAQERETELRQTAALATLEAAQLQHEQEQEAAHRALARWTQHVEDVQARYPQAVAGAEEMWKSYLPMIERVSNTEAIAEIIHDIEEATREIAQQCDTTLHRLIQEATIYNVRYLVVANPADPEEPRYEAESLRLTEQELPAYQTQIEEARNKTVTALFTQVIIKLRERLFTAQQQIERFNQALSKFDLYGEQFRLCVQPDVTLNDYSTLITSMDETVGVELLIQGSFSGKQQMVFDRFLTLFTRPHHAEAEQQEQEHLLDYRNYLHYNFDFQETRTNDDLVPQSKHQETPTGFLPHLPCYLVLASACVQLYRLSDQGGYPTFRLVPFNKTFATLNQQSKAAILDVFGRLKLQVLTPASSHA